MDGPGVERTDPATALWHASTPGLSRERLGDPAAIEAEEPGRGRLAESPRHIPWRGWRDILWRVGREFSEDRLTVVAGGVTFFTLLSVFPALGAFVSLYGLFADLAAVRDQLAQLAVIFPPEAVALVGEQMVRLANGDAANLSFAFGVSLLFSLWSASAGIRALFDGLNVVYEETERRHILARTAMTYVFTIVLLVFLGAISAILVAAPIVMAWVGVRETWLVAARWPLVFLVAAGFFAMAYRHGPSRRAARWRWIAPGALAAAGFWIAGSAGFSWYLNNIARLDATYGSLGAVIGFMLWVWFSVLVVLTGAEFNAEIEHQTARDSTVGPPKPMGQRGAVMADTVGLRFSGVRAGLSALASRVRGVSRIRLPGRPVARPDPRRSAAR